MKTKHIISAIALASLPFTALAAGTIPVTQGADASITAQQDAKGAVVRASHGNKYKISGTASPDANRAARESLDQGNREATEIIAPTADDYMDRKTVSVGPKTIVEDHIDFKYPEVTSPSAFVTKSINDILTKYVNKVKKDLEKTNESATNKQNVTMYYDVAEDTQGILSILIHTYTVSDKDANGVHFVKSFVFNTTTGRKLSLYDLGGINKDGINDVINAIPDIKAKFGDDFTGLKDMPKEFYAMGDHNVIMIVQEGAEAPHSAGTIYIPVGILRGTANQK